MKRIPVFKKVSVLRTGLLLMLFLLAAPFAFYSLQSGFAGFRGITTQPRFLLPEAPLGNWLIFSHMVLGGWITLQAPLQIWAFPRLKWPRAHRIGGYILSVAALLTGLLGCLYIFARGTIGGPVMDAGFGVYGLLMVVATAMTVQAARARRFHAHRRWALRLFVLAIGSWLYRVHYGVWYAITGGLASNDAFTGAFDIVQNVAFYVPYLLLLEAWFVMERRRAQ